ncbi:MAG: TonB C-terminal domain-containing protein [bacterium]|nr:TonB C-terminal domain-containing protein [bacterium]
MEKRNYAPAFPMGAGIESRTMLIYFGISLAIHLVFIGFMIYRPGSHPRPRLGQTAINVSLVSLPGPPKAVSAPAPAPEPKNAAQTVAIPKKKIKAKPKAPVIETPAPKPPPVLPQPKKTVSLAPNKQKPKVKKSLKKKTQNRQKMIEQAMTNVQKKVENTQSDSFKQTIDRLKKKVAQSEASASQPGQTPKGIQGATGAGIQGAGASGGKRALEITDLYKIEVAFQVERRWAFSQQVAGDGRALQVSLVFRVLPSGEITDIRFTQKSGNTYLDDSAYRAIVKANPVSPHPEAIRVPYVTVGVRFTPEGMRK